MNEQKFWEEQKDPIPNKNVAVWDLVLTDFSILPLERDEYVLDKVKDDINLRDNTGKQKYGVRLQAFNGRNALQDVYEEKLDALVYLRQAIEENEISGLSNSFASRIRSIYCETLQHCIQLKQILMEVHTEKKL